MIHYVGFFQLILTLLPTMSGGRWIFGTSKFHSICNINSEINVCKRYYLELTERFYSSSWKERRMHRIWHNKYLKFCSISPTVVNIKLVDNERLENRAVRVFGKTIHLTLILKNNCWRYVFLSFFTKNDAFIHWRQSTSVADAFVKYGRKTPAPFNA